MDTAEAPQGFSPELDRKLPKEVRFPFVFLSNECGSVTFYYITFGHTGLCECFSWVFTVVISPFAAAFLPFKGINIKLFF